jgi:hypothetical protein
MRRLLNVLRLRLRSGRAAPARPAPVTLTCACGRPWEGVRKATAQVVRCGACGESLFVLPVSPLPPVEGDSTRKPRGRSPWLLPAVAALVTLTAVVVGFVVFFRSLEPASGDAGRSGPTTEAAMEAGRRLLGEGNFREAFKELQAARWRDPRDPELGQLHRQAELLAQLLRQPLQEIIQQGQTVRRPEEWAEQFKDYQGRAVLFDDVVRQGADGKLELAVYEVRADGEVARVVLDLKVLEGLPLEVPRRLVFGARLSSVAREAGGVWVVRFDPDSGVLLTDEDAVRASGLAPVDSELRAVLRQQAEWLRQMR